MTDGAGNLIVDYDYDSAGRLERKTLGNGVYTTYQYDAAGNVRLLVNHRSDNTVLSRFEYAYDVSGRRTSMTTLEGTWAYGYDALGQLVSVRHPDGRVVTYTWNFGDGTPNQVSDGPTTTHVFPNTPATCINIVYAVLLTVEDDKQERGTFSSNVQVTEDCR